MSATPAERLVALLPESAFFREGYLTGFLDTLARDFPAIVPEIEARIVMHTPKPGTNS